jgi:hypothetical protein
MSDTHIGNPATGAQKPAVDVIRLLGTVCSLDASGKMVIDEAKVSKLAWPEKVAVNNFLRPGITSVASSMTTEAEEHIKPIREKLAPLKEQIPKLEAELAATALGKKLLGMKATVQDLELQISQYERMIGTPRQTRAGGARAKWSHAKAAQLMLAGEKSDTVISDAVGAGGPSSVYHVRKKQLEDKSYVDRTTEELTAIANGAE